MQHFDIASVRATVIPSNDFLAFEAPLVIEGWSEIDTSTEVEALPIEAFAVEVDPLSLMNRKTRQREIKRSSKARSLDRHNARVAKRARFA